MTIEKQFFTKRKTVSYSFDIWLKAENYFKTVDQVKSKGSAVKIHLGGEMFLMSNIWGEYQKRYTGIHGFDLGGFVITNTGVNLHDDEWCMLTFNFSSIKEAFLGKKDALKNISTRLKKDPNVVKVFKAEWYLGSSRIILLNQAVNFSLGKRLNKMCTVENQFQEWSTLRKMCILIYEWIVKYNLPLKILCS